MPGRDPTHWLHRLSAEEWLRAAMKELGTARDSFSRHAIRPGLASARRAAGMGWNAVLALEEEPDAAFGRSYVDHLRALASGVTLSNDDVAPIPVEVRAAAKRLLDDPAAGPPQAVVLIQTPKRDASLYDAAETIVAEAYARVVRRSAPPTDSRP
jgi:hypothetical protein